MLIKLFNNVEEFVLNNKNAKIKITYNKKIAVEGTLFGYHQCGLFLLKDVSTNGSRSQSFFRQYAAAYPGLKTICPIDHNELVYGATYSKYNSFQIEICVRVFEREREYIKQIMLKNKCP